MPSAVNSLALAAPFGMVGGVNHAGEKGSATRVRLVLQATSPQSVLRAIGPLGPQLMDRYRGEYECSRYAYKDKRVIEYVYHLNAAAGSGEFAFQAMQDGFGIAKDPLIPKLSALQAPLTIVYGDQDCIPLSSGIAVREVHGRTQMYVVRGSGHHMYATHRDAFHRTLMTGLDAVDGVQALPQYERAVEYVPRGRKVMGFLRRLAWQRYVTTRRTATAAASLTAGPLA